MDDKNKETRANRSKKNKKKNSSKAFWSVFKYSVAIMLFLMFIGGAVATGWVINIVKDADPIAPKDVMSLLTETSVILDDKGNEIEKITNLEAEARTIIGYNQIPKHLRDAFIAGEDERFLSHKGVDIKRVFGAMYQVVRQRSFAQGASTITMQLARNIYLSPEKEIERKIAETYYAFIIESQLSKDEILHAYLNTIFLGGRAYGVEEAAKYYFDKSAEELSIAESAMIAGINPAPNSWNPYVNPKQAENRQRIVLSNMLRLGMIDDQQYSDAVDEKIVLKQAAVEETIKLSSYFADQVKKDVIKDLIEEKGYSRDDATRLLYYGGLRIHTTLDTDVQLAIEEVFQDLGSLDARLAITGYDESGEVPQPQASMVIIDHTTGEVKGLIGGRDFGRERNKFNRVTEAPRSPGSAAKPLFAYTPFIDRGGTVASVFDDAPMYDNKGALYPNNWYVNKDAYKGLMTVREAINWSVNTIAMKVFEEAVGIETGVEYAQKLGLTSVTRSDEVRSAVLGGIAGVTNLEITSAYSTLANQGVYIEPTTYTKVTDSKGNVIFQKSQEKRRAVSEDTAYLMTNLLASAVAPGSITARSANLDSLGIEVAGKTGTSQDNVDFWFVGYTPYYSGGVWIGNDDNKSLANNFTSGVPSNLFGTVMKKVHAAKELSAKRFKPTSNIVTASICTESGKLATDLCARDPRGSTIKSEVFARGTVPTESCDVHVEVQVDTTNLDPETGKGLKLAGPYCPPANVETRVLIQRPTSYIVPPNGKVPIDAIYEVPTEYCDIHLTPLPIDNNDGNDDGGDDEGENDEDNRNGNNN